MKFIRVLLLENWGLKLTSVFLAFFLWMVVRGDPSAERVINVALEIRLPRNMEITSERPSTVDVTVRGAFTNLWFSPTIPTYVVDLSSYDEGEHIIQLSPQNVRFPRASGLEPMAVRPARIKVRLERAAVKEVPIRVVTRGEPGAGIDVYGITTRPAAVTLSGPHSNVDRIREVSTEAIALNDQRQSIRKLVNLDIRDDAVHCAPSTPVEVHVELGAHRRLQRVAKVPVSVGDAAFTVNPRWITVQVLVPITYEKGMTAADFAATVTVPGLAPGQTSAKAKPEVRLKVPNDPAVVIREIEPAEVVVQKKAR